MNYYKFDLLYNSKALTTEYVINRYGEYNIYSYYLGYNFDINTVFNSPFREDNNPSFGIFKSKNGRLLFKDLATGEGGTILDFVKIIYPELQRRKSILLQIHMDLSTNRKQFIFKPENGIKEKTKSIIGINRNSFSKEDLEYWSKYNITEEILSKFEVYKAERVYLDDKIIWIYDNNNPIYAYKIYNHFKIYRPFADKKHKWLGNCDRHDIFGYYQLPEQGDLVIITKSAKDVMCLYSLGYNAISPASETCAIPVKAIKDLKQRFKIILVFFDNDEPGIKAAERLEIKYDLNYFYIPKETLIKDITDYCDQKGTEKTKELLKRLISV
jgi:hypothetical protein